MDLKNDLIETLTDLEGYYWLKTELIHACKIYHLCTQVLKQELVARLKFFHQSRASLKPLYYDDNFNCFV